jgi:tetratricopeptide (TPR) repeat protein
MGKKSKADTLYEDANDAFDAGDYAEAAEKYAAVLKRSPGFVEAAYNGATSLLLCDRFADAMVGFRETLRLDPEHAAACSNGAVAAIRLKDFAGAVELGRRALAIDPELTDALPNLGNALIRTGDLAGAKEIAAQLDDIDPEAAERLRHFIAHPPTADQDVQYSGSLDGEPLDEDPLQKAYQLLNEIEAEDADHDADLVLAAYFGDVAKAKHALDAGASPDAQQKGTGYSALILAVSNDHAKIVELLLKSGANANSKATVTVGRKKQTVTALDRADAEGKTTIAKLLRKHGATA